jgi:hypothetical protein
MQVRRAHALVGGAVVVALCAIGGVPVAAQTAPACPLITDATLAQALGPSAHGQVAVALEGIDACSIVGSDPSPVGVFHVAGVFPAGQVAGTFELLGALLHVLPAAPASDAEADTPNQTPAALEATSVTGLADAAVLLTQTAGDQKLDSLLVQRGPDGFAFTVSDSPGAVDRLLALAQAVTQATTTSTSR